ncbi:hypothetical protein EV1_014203 [Malus domestica]
MQRFVEQIVGYDFRNKGALTHSCYSESPSFQRLKFIGNAALCCAPPMSLEKTRRRIWWSLRQTLCLLA